MGHNGYIEAAHLLAKIGDASLRLGLMRELVAGHEDDPQALFALALVEVGSHNLPQAEAATRRALALRPGWNEARVLLVRILGAQNKTQEARRALERFLAESPEDVTLRAAYARLLVEQEDLRAARAQFERVLEHEPEDADTLFALGILSLQLGERGAAKDYLRRLHATGSHTDDAAFYLGQILEEEGDVQAALRWYNKADGAHSFDAQVRIARLYASQGKVRRAREIIQQIRAHAGKESEVQLDLVEGQILRDVKHYDAAMEVLTRALQDNPDNHDILYARALVAASLGRLDILERDLRRILDQDPRHADALNALGYTLADQTDRHAEALGYIQRALRLKPDSAAVLDSMGWVQYRMGNNEEALRYLWRALDLLPDAEIAAHLGEVLWAAGERKRARKVWEDALAREPQSDYLLRVLDRYGKHF